MNHENDKSEIIEKMDLKQEPPGAPGDGDGVGEPAENGKAFKVAAGRMRGLRRPGFVITGVALCMGLASCAIPQ